MSDGSKKSGNDAVIQPFTVEVPDSELDSLRVRIRATRWPDKETVADHSQGVQLATIQELARFWANDYDWRRCESTLNALPQFITEIDGLAIHFIHVRSQHESALPLIVTHGWPGSMIEQLKIIDPLTNPTGHGASASDAFHLVIPSMPGYGFSGKPTAIGWDPARIARTWVTLMNRLGYTRFVAQGGDWGGLITEVMAAQAPPGLLAVHTNFPGTVPPDMEMAIQSGSPPPASLSAGERRAYEQLQAGSKQRGYASEMGTRPQTMSGLADSPLGLATWMLDHDRNSEERILAGHRRGPLVRRHHTGRSRRQHHALLADEHRRFLGSPLLGKQVQLFRRKEHLYPGCGERLPWRALSSAAELGRTRLQRPHLLQRARYRGPLRRLGAAGTFLRRGSRRLPVPSLDAAPGARRN